VRCGTVATVLHCFIWYFDIFVGAATPTTHNMAPPLNRGVRGPSCWRCDGSVSSTREKYTQQSRPRADNKNDQGVAPWLATRTRAATDRWPEETPRALVFAFENQGFLVASMWNACVLPFENGFRGPVKVLNSKAPAGSQRPQAIPPDYYFPRERNLTAQ
jgi:hypothetical protein